MSKLSPNGGPTNFMLVGHMNNAFGNAKGNPHNVDWMRVAKQLLNVADEMAETFVALGADKDKARAAAETFKASLKAAFGAKDFVVDTLGVRDGITDMHVFAYGAHHLMGMNADDDMQSVIDGVMTRFIKDENDKIATIAKHAAKGVTDVYFEGEYPTMIMKSKVDQPDAPAGKFLKSASYTEPVFKRV